MSDPEVARDGSGENESAYPWFRRAALIGGPIAFGLLRVTEGPADLSADGWATAAVAAWIVLWWLTEAVPLAVTALLPIVLFPLVGIGTLAQATAPYANPIIYLFLGGFLMAQGAERSGLPRRIALAVVHTVGTSPFRVIGGMMLVSAGLSMWVSNTATVVMLLPIALSIQALASGPGLRNFGVALALGVAYASSVGGMATLIGTPPNALMAGFLRETYGIDVGFAEWMLVGLPMALIGLPITWFVLAKVLYPVAGTKLAGTGNVIAEQRRALGPMSRGEILVSAVIASAALCWTVLPLTIANFPLSDSMVAVAAAIALFVIPTHPREGRFLMDWSVAARVPWGVLLLFGGGLSIAGALTRSGLADWIGANLSGLSALHEFFIILAVVALIVMMTEVTSNTAITASMLPVVGAVSVTVGIIPTELAIPATLAASCAFMLPVATPPNAIVYGSGLVTGAQMLRAGMLMNMIFIVAIAIFSYLLAPVLKTF
jgi:sodium-dependent dicarboxylate transporter 2/3/5